MTPSSGQPIEDREPTIADLGEFGLLRHIRALAGSGSPVVGIGDDAAVLDVGSPDYLLATTDMLVEGVHFTTTWDPYVVGRRAISVNVSDVAAMGGCPGYALTSLALPPNTPVRFVTQLYKGFSDGAERYGVSLVGGNLTRTPGPISIDVLLLGSVAPTNLVLRSGARPGDLVAVTGSLGDAAAARLVREQGAHAHDTAVEKWLGSHRWPEVRVREAQRLAAARAVHAMMDLSDGLAGDIRHLCEASNVGALIRADSLPISIETRRAAQSLGLPALDLALTGGEDYELLLALSPTMRAAAQEACGDVPLVVIGACTQPDEGINIVDFSGRRHPLSETGWRHF